MKKYLIIILSLFLLTGCSQFALISSGAGIAITNNAYVKVYNGIDLATTLTTKKDIKTHAYHYVKASIEQSKKVNEYVFEKFNDLIKNKNKFIGSVEKKTFYKVDAVLINAVNAVNEDSNKLIKKKEWINKIKKRRRK